jgi:hypothetical protein
MIKVSSALSVVVVLAAAISAAAQATVIFTPGDNPQAGEENIMFETAQTGTTITGDTNQSGTSVQFTSPNSLSTQGHGQASLTATTGGDITNVTFSIPGDTFGDYIFDPMHGSGTATVTAVANDGSFTDNISLGEGNNFLTITTTGGETLASVNITAPIGFTTYDQPRVSDISSVTAASEPASLALLASAFVGFGILSRFRRRGLANTRLAGGLATLH